MVHAEMQLLPVLTYTSNGTITFRTTRIMDCGSVGGLSVLVPHIFIGQNTGPSRWPISYCRTESMLSLASDMQPTMLHISGVGGYRP